MKNLPERRSNFLLYSSQTSNINIDVVILDETVWLTQKSMGELFGVQRPAITKHLNNIFKEWELQENSVSSILEHTAADGKIGKLEAKLKAEHEYETYRKMQDKNYISDFDREIKRISKKKHKK